MDASLSPLIEAEGAGEPLQPIGRLSPLSVAQEDKPTSQSSHSLLYTSHFLSTWNSRLFEFGAFLFLASIYPATLLPASVYALARAAAGAVLSPWIGSYIDRHDRLGVVRLSIAGQRLPVMLSCVVFILMLFFPQVSSTTVGFVGALMVLSILACIEKLAIVMNTISVERDWVVVIAAGQELNVVNSQMRRIDLFCKLVAPLAVSLLDTYSTKVAVLATGGLSLVSWSIEYFAIARVYRAVPALQTRLTRTPSDDKSLRQCLSTFSSGIRVYCSSDALLPSFSLSLLYLTALSFNGQLITYILAPPILLPAIVLSVLRGVAACAELSATFFGPMLIARITPLRAGSWFLNGQLVFIAVAAGTLWLPSTAPVQFHLPTLLIVIILSRIGLWGFDLAAQNQIQDAVPESSRGAFSSIEAALQNTFEMISFASTIVWSKPEDFKYPGAMSAGAVLVAAVLYAMFVRKERGHLLHFDKAICGATYWKTHFGKAQSAAWSRVPDDEPS